MSASAASLDSDVKMTDVKPPAPTTDSKDACGESKDTPLSLSLDDASLSGNIKLTSMDKKEFVVSKKAAFISETIKTTLDTDSSATEVPTAVKSHILELVVEYLAHHDGVPGKKIEKPLKSKVMKDVVADPWDATFIDNIAEDRQKLYDLILAFNWMHIQCGLELGCAKTASLIKGQPLEKIKEILQKGIVKGATDAKDDGKEEKKA